MSLRKFFLFGISWHTLSSVVSALSQALIMLLAARLFNPEDLGLLYQALIWMRIAYPLIDMGFTNGIIQSENLTHKVASTLFWLQNAIAVALTILTFSFGSIGLSMFFDNKELIQLMKLMSMTFIFMSPGLVYNAYLQKKLKFDLTSKVKIIASLAELTLAILLIYSLNSIIAVAIAYMAKHLITSFISFIASRPFLKLSFSFDIKSAIQILKFSLYDFGAQFVNQWSGQIDRILVGKLMGETALGLYALAWDIVIIPTSKLSSIINTTAFPLFSTAQKNSNKLGELYKNAIKTSLYITLPILILLASMPTSLVLSFLGSQWTGIVPLLPLVTLAALFQLTSGLGYDVIMAKGNSKIGFWWTLLWTIFLGAILFIFIKPSTTINEVTIMVVLAIYSTAWLWHLLVYRIGRFPYSPVIRAIGHCLIVALPAFLFSILITSYIDYHQILAIILTAMSTLFIYILSVKLLDKNFFQSMYQTLTDNLTALLKR